MRDPARGEFRCLPAPRRAGTHHPNASRCTKARDAGPVRRPGDTADVRPFKWHDRRRVLGPAAAIESLIGRTSLALRWATRFQLDWAHITPPLGSAPAPRSTTEPPPAR